MDAHIPRAERRRRASGESDGGGAQHDHPLPARSCAFNQPCQYHSITTATRSSRSSTLRTCPCKGRAPELEDAHLPLLTNLAPTFDLRGETSLSLIKRERTGLKWRGCFFLSLYIFTFQVMNAVPFRLFATTVLMLADERLTEADTRRAISRFVANYNKHNQKAYRLPYNGNYTQLQFT